ncbi:hypothetical protein [Glycomyces xiaoerkulensis]|uniref:hypothetical protein n=1 Tax=Glycomyces xiaoerkulensis TaxID=2038139 RepID=UPI000C25A128|nr:hypothetical protein [Glycomyces xiaoerkulensis]
MTTTAWHAVLGRLDLSEGGLGAVPPWWKSLYHHNAPISCRSCGGDLIAVENLSSRYRKRYFRHRPTSESRCRLRESDTEERFFVKHVVASRVRECPGWSAEVEAQGGGWCADVLAVHPDGTRFAWEVRSAADSAADLERRATGYAADGVEVCWATLGRPDWSGTVPTIAIRPDESVGPLVVGGVRALSIRSPGTVGDAAAAISELGAPGAPHYPENESDRPVPWWTWGELMRRREVPPRTSPSKPAPIPVMGSRSGGAVWAGAGERSLGSFVADALAGRLQPVALTGPFRERDRPTSDVVWASRADLGRAMKYVAWTSGWRVLDQPGVACDDCGTGGVLLLRGASDRFQWLCADCDRELYTAARGRAHALELT